MVVLAGGSLAMGRYEVTVGEYRAFASATAGGTGGGCIAVGGGDSWRDPGFPQTESPSGDVRELGRRAGLRVMAEPSDGCVVSVAD